MTFVPLDLPVRVLFTCSVFDSNADMGWLEPAVGGTFQKLRAVGKHRHSATARRRLTVNNWPAVSMCLSVCPCMRTVHVCTHVHGDNRGELSGGRCEDEVCVWAQGTSHLPEILASLLCPVLPGPVCLFTPTCDSMLKCVRQISARCLYFCSQALRPHPNTTGPLSPVPPGLSVLWLTV